MRRTLVGLVFFGLIGLLPMAGHAAAAPAPATTIDSIDPAFPQAFTERSLGDANAPVTMTEYSALTCPHCAHFHTDVLPKLKENYISKGKLRIVFKEFPFSQLGLHAAMAARCLAPEAYDDFTASLFSTQSSWSESNDGETIVRQMAGFAGLSPEKYTACTASKPLQDFILNGRVHATNDLQISSTPTFLFKGGLERIVGAQDYDQFAAAIDRQLAKAK